MLSKTSSQRLSAIVLTLALGVLATGCEQARNDIAAAIHPRSAHDVLKNVRQHIADGKFKEARDDGETFLAKHGDDTGVLAWELSKACVQLGDNERAIRYIEQAIHAHAVSGIDLMSEPMLEPVRTDPRLAALAAGMAPTHSAKGITVPASAHAAASARPAPHAASAQPGPGDVATTSPH